MKKWADKKMSLNFTKTWKMYMHGKNTKLSPPELPGIKRKSWVKLLGVTFEEDATNWDIHIENMLYIYPKPVDKCTFLGCANPMDYPKINSIISLTRSLCPYSCMGLRFLVQLTSENI